jgi:hypothetical protein
MTETFVMVAPLAAIVTFTYWPVVLGAGTVVSGTAGATTAMTFS